MIRTYVAIDRANIIWKECNKDIPENWDFIKKGWEIQGFSIIEFSGLKSDFNNIESYRLNLLYEEMITITDYSGNRFSYKNQYKKPFHEFWSELE